MGIKRHGFRWVLGCGLIFSVGLGVGCSDDGKAPTAQSTGSSANASSASTPSRPSTQAPSGKPAPPSPSPTPAHEEAGEPTAQALIEGGRSAYNANCIACHSMDPTKDGALGPAVSGSSLVLLETRVLRGEYPEGYEAKRTTRVMIPLPHLEPRLAELAAYLNSVE